MAAASTTPSPSPASSTGRSAAAVRTIGGAPRTASAETGGGSGSPGGSLRASSSIIGYCLGVLRTGRPKPTGSARPAGGGVKNRQVGRGLGVLKRSNCRSDRSTTSPTLISRATGAIASGSSTPSWSRRSSALSRSAEGGEPYGISSRAT